MANYASHITSPPPQSEKSRDDQVLNNAGGYVYKVDDLVKLDRFLILGCEKGSYYASERTMTLDNAKTISNLLNTDVANAKKVIDRVVEISQAGRAPKNDPSLFVMALATCNKNSAVLSYVVEKLPLVARTATHLFTYVDYVNAMRGWGSSFKKAVANWYISKDAGSIAYQVTKYPSRKKEGSQSWSHKDLLRMAHPKPKNQDQSDVFSYIVKKNMSFIQESEVLKVSEKTKSHKARIYAHEKIKTFDKKDIEDAIALIKDFGLVRESIPTSILNSKEVWEQLLQEMPVNAILRNIGKMSEIDLIGDFKDSNNLLISKITNHEILKKARVHPFEILKALLVYSSGRGFRSDKKWKTSTAIINALNESFYAAFDFVVPTNKNIFIAVDCSGSMSSPLDNIPMISSRTAAAVIAMTVARSEKNYMITGFSHSSLGKLHISHTTPLEKVENIMETFPWGNTDCSLPMTHCIKANLNPDAFVVITDNETWAGSVKPEVALNKYRKKSGKHDAKLVVVATTATDFTIGDPLDKNTLNIAGMDSNVPNLVSDFIRGDI